MRVLKQEEMSQVSGGTFCFIGKLLSWKLSLVSKIVKPVCAPAPKPVCAPAPKPVCAPAPVCAPKKHC